MASEAGAKVCSGRWAASKYTRLRFSFGIWRTSAVMVASLREKVSIMVRASRSRPVSLPRASQ